MIPVLDPRDNKDLIKQMQALFPVYTPEWKFTPENPDPGTALFMIFAQMYEETIKRLNKVPLKNYVAYLNMLDVVNQPPKPSSSYITFNLSAGAKDPVLIPAGTQMTAAEVDGNGQVVFETVADMLATPAEPVTAYSVDPVKDSIIPLGSDIFRYGGVKEKEGIKIFDSADNKNKQMHELYIAHSNVFNISSKARIELEFRNTTARYMEASICERLADEEKVLWMYSALNKDGELEWRKFDGISCVNGVLALTKIQEGPIEKSQVQGVESRWIRCSLKKGVSLKDAAMEFDSILTASAFLKDDKDKGLKPEMVFHNDIQEEPGSFYPFGEFFALFDAFYICSQEVFSKRKSQVTLSFDLSYVINSLKTAKEKEIEWKLIMKSSELQKPEPPLEITITKVAWEYWNGKGWVKLFSIREYEEIFCSKGDNPGRTITFTCPEDMEETFVNNQLNFWIRARVISLRNIFEANTVYSSPKLDNFYITYEFKQGRFPVEACSTYNNLEWYDRTELIKTASRAFLPFYGMGYLHPTLIIGFEQPPMKGPLSMLALLHQRMEEGSHAFQWEYLKSAGGMTEWDALKLHDGTRGFSEDGTIVFAGPQDFARHFAFGQELYWMRVSLMGDGKASKPNEAAMPMVRGLYMNTTPVVQQESIYNESFDAASGIMNKQYQLKQYPVISEEVWVEEAGRLTDEDMVKWLREKPGRTKVVKDELGTITEFWILWENTEDFLECSEQDRIYVIDRAGGCITFGDGIHGCIPPGANRKNIIVNYKTGGGERGNIGEGGITNLLHSIAFVDNLSNPVPACGGCNMETVEEVMQRGPQMLKHRNRAVTVGDFEWLARQASQNISKVKCLPNVNKDGHKVTGCLTMVIFPKGEIKSPAMLTDLKAQVKRYLLERTSATAAYSDKISVSDPAYMEISVNATLNVEAFERILPAEKEALEVLNRFLHPNDGNYGKAGWEIGQIPHISMFFTLLKGVKNVSYVEKVAVTVCEIRGEQRIERDFGSMQPIPDGIVTNGKHQIIVKVI